ncbi:MAG TPA: glutamate--tRNA ligase family protein, partial [Tepidisphaeraceae bacterium]|nr:glutamate--tRNA ligase family protein [Tepidisphaeraceae bacterium]
MRITRLAPSPTGALHLGNARTFLANWLLARQNGWTIILRIEDLDGPRIKAGADRQAIDDLRWLGIDWDEGPIYQSTRLEIYAKAVQQLIDAGRAYPCICSRREIDQSASAPHAEDGSNVYPGTCRGKFNTVEEARAATGKNPAIRFAIEQEEIEFTDAFAGQKEF